MKILTVIVPTYNMEKYLDKCLTSLIVLDLSLMDLLEVLVVNDGSKDRSSEIAHEYESRYPNTFKVIDKQNGNYGSCINAALPVVTGKYVKILDADDWFETTCFQPFISTLTNIEVDMILSNFSKVNDEGIIIETSSWKGRVIPNQILTIKELYDSGVVSEVQMHSVAYRTDLLRKINYKQTEGISYTDTEWVVYPLARIETVFYIDEILYMYLFGREGQTVDVSVFRKKFSDLTKIADRMLCFYNQMKNDSINYLCIEKRLSVFITHIIYRNYFNNNFSKKQILEFDKFIKDKYPLAYHKIDDLSVEINGYWLPLRYWHIHILWLFNNSIYRFIQKVRVHLSIRTKIKKVFDCKSL